MSALRERIQTAGEILLTPRGFALALGKAALILAVLFALKSGSSLRRAAAFDLPELRISDQLEDVGAKLQQPLENFDIIASRNLFGSTIPVPVPDASTANIPKPKLRLVGTNATGGKGSFAIIEDQNKNEQDVFSVNEQVFAFGKLIEISPETVKLQYPDRVDILEIEEGKSSAPSSGGGEVETPALAGDDQTEFSVSESELSEALSNLPLLLSQARAVPYFRNGQSIGMRLFAIRSGSLYEKLGLRNGDIVTAVNESSLSDPTQALRLFEQLKNERNISVKMERNGGSREARYSIR